MRIQSHTRPAKLPREQSLLLASCAVGLALVAIARAPEAHAQSFNGSVTSATGASVATAPGRTDITVTAPRAVINWQPTDTAAGATPIQFQSAPGTPTDGAFFTGNADYTILNRILPTGAATGRAIALNGRVVSEINTGSVPVTGGNVWFYSPGGIAIGANATFDVGSLLLSTLDVTDADFLDGDTSYGFSTIDGSTAAITIAPGAAINALNESSYVAMIAPRVDQAGTVNVNGTATYVAAEEATITMPGGLFTIDVSRGTTATTAISHRGTTTGPGSSGAGDVHATTMVAIPKNNAITMLVGGSLGYAASGAGIVNGVVQLYAGYDLPDGATPTADNGGFAADIAVTGSSGSGVFLSSALTARASRDVSIVASESSGGIVATGGITLRADRNAALSASRNLTVNGDLTLAAGGQVNAAIAEESGYGGALTVTGNMLLDASRTGAAGGTGTGGIAELAVSAGTLTTSGTLTILANGLGGAGGGDGTGGTARFSVTGGFVDVGNVTISADGFGNGNFNDPVLNGGGGTGGLAEFVQSGGDFLADFLSISANGTGGENDVSLPGGSGGTGTGGDANFIRSGGTRTDISSGLDLSARGNGGAATGTGGNATSGDTLLQVTGGATTLGFLVMDISATGGNTGGSGADGGASGVGHSARILAGGAGTSLDAGGGIIVNANASVVASGSSTGDLAAGAIQIEAQSGASITGSGFAQLLAEAYSPNSADRTGAARGGNISIGGAGGTVAIAGTSLISVGGFSGEARVAGGSAAAGTITLFASNGGTLTFANRLDAYADSTGGNAPNGSNATGGTILAYAEDGALTLGSSSLFSAAGTAGFNTSGANPGTGTGGTITIQSRATAANLSSITLGDFEGVATGFGVFEGDGFIPTSGSAGHGVGGTIAFDLLGGTLNAATIDIDAGATGGVSLSASSGATPTGGNATGGTARFTMSGGTATIDILSVSADGFGGGVRSGASDPVAALAGSGTGGSASIEVNGGTLNATGIEVHANGSGGMGASSSDGATSAGGAGLGGTARLSLGGTSAVNAQFVDIFATGSGGNGGSTASGLAAMGGAGTGGAAQLSILGGTLSTGSAQIMADGRGGAGGVSQDTGTPADGGIGRGGIARLYSKGDFFTITDLAIGARGQGGAGGYEFGYGQGGGGGDGGNGFGGGAALDLDYDPVIASLLIDASGTGGNGGDGAIGGNGGDGFGGINVAGVGGANLSLNAGALTVSNATIRSDGAGGQGGFGSAGSGGSGGNGTGGDATIAVSGAGAVLTLSPDSSANATTLSAYGIGGGAGSSSINALGVGAAGGNGGAGTGGDVRFDILNGGRVLAGAFVGIAADGFGGNASNGAGAAAGGGAGGNGGAATGGTALLNIDGGALLAFDPASPLDWTINANGFAGNGGLGGDGATGGAGGSGAIGRGGSARIAANNAEYALGAILLDAEGFGGNGQFGTNGAAAGTGGDGFGGTAGFANSDDSTTPPTGARSLASLTLIAEGIGGLVADQPSGLDHAGRAELADGAGASGGSVQIGSLSALTRGLGDQPGAGFFLTSTAGPLTVNGDSFVDSGAAASFAFSGNGSFVTGGNLSVLALAGIAVTHAGAPSGTAYSSISASQLNFATPGNFTADAVGVLRSNSSILITANGNIAVGNLFAVDRIGVYAGGNLTLGNAGVTATVFPPFGGAPTTGVVDLIAGNASNGFVPADLTLTGTITATGHISAQSGGDIIVASGANLISDNRITFRSGDDILVRSGALVRAAANPLPEFGYGVSGPLGEPALLDFSAGAIAVAPTVPGNVAAIIVDGTIGAPDRAVTLTAGAIQADANAIDSKNFYAQLVGVPATGNPANNDGGQLRADCVAGNICLGALGASNIVRIGPVSGAIDLPGRVSIAGNIDAADIVIRARDALAFNGTAAIHGTNRLFLTVLNGDLTGSGTFALSGDNLVNVYAGGSIAAPQGSISAAGNLGLSAGGGIDLGTIAAGGLLQQINSDGALTQADGLTLTGALRANTRLSVGGGNLRLNAANGIAIGTLQVANGSALLQAANGVVAVNTDLATAGGVIANGQSVTLTAIGDLNVTDALASAGAITLTSTTGNLSLGAASAGSAFTANARGMASFNGQVAAQTITVNSGDITIGVGGQLGAIGRTTSVAITNNDATRQTYIGGADTSAGYSLSAVEIGRIFGDSIGVTAPRVSTLSPTSVGSTRAPDVIVGAFTLTGRAAGSSGNLGPGALSITTPGRLRVNGAVQLTGLAATNRLAISATDALEIDAATGSIDLRDAGGGFGGVLQLTSDDIIAASLPAIVDVGAAGSIDAIDDRLAINDGAVDDDGYLSANRIEVNARNGFYVQNSGAGDEFADRRGFTVGTGGIAVTTGSTSTRIVINGRQSDGAGGFVTGTDMIDRVSINGRTGLAVTGIDRRSTINGCLIANPVCAGFVLPNTLLSREVFEAPVDPESAEEALQQLFPLTLVELRDFEPFGFEPLIDEPVTGAGNDDLWVPECDPAIEQCAGPQQQ